MASSELPDSERPRIKVRLYGELAKYSGGRGYEFDWPHAPGRTIQALLDEIGIPGIEVWMVALNGAKVERDAIPAAGDEVMIFSPVGGG